MHLPFQQAKYETTLLIPNGKNDFILQLRKFTRPDEPVFVMFQSASFAGLIGDHGFRLTCLRSFRELSIKASRMDIEAKFVKVGEMDAVELRFSENDFSSIIRKFLILFPSVISLIVLLHHLFTSGPHNYFVPLFPLGFSLVFFLMSYVNRFYWKSEFAGCYEFMQRLCQYRQTVP